MKLNSLDYLRIAEDCLKKAFAATDDVIRAQWTQLADRWRTLAARIAESERVMAEYYDPAGSSVWRSKATITRS